MLVSPSGLVTVTGGKWTTYRAMAEDVLRQCLQAGLLPERGAARSDQLALVGAPPTAGAPPSEPPHPAQGPAISAPPGAHLYGSEAAVLATLPGAGRVLAEGLDEAMVRFAVRHEYAHTVEDVMARRARLLFLDAAEAARIAPAVAAIVQSETGADPQLKAFLALTQDYLRCPA